MADLALDIATYLQTQAHGTLTTTLFAGFLPDAPDDCVAVFATGGIAPIETFTPVPAVRRPGLMVQVRAATYAAAQTKATNVWVELVKVINTTLSGTRYTLTAKDDPAAISRDEGRRVIFSMNFEVHAG